MTTPMMSDEIRSYVEQTAEDLGEDISAVIRVMREDPGTFAEVLGCTADDVLAWCAGQSESTKS